MITGIIQRIMIMIIIISRIITHPGNLVLFADFSLLGGALILFSKDPEEILLLIGGGALATGGSSGWSFFDSLTFGILLVTTVASGSEENDSNFIET